MKKLFVIFSLLVSFSMFMPAVAADDSMKTLSRLLVYNKEGHTLLIKVKEGFWVTPAVHNKSADLMVPALNKLAASYGLTVSEPVLQGMFFVKYDFPQNQGLYNRMFFRVEQTGGKVQLPDGIIDYKWVSDAEAIDMLSFEHITAPMKQIVAQPDRVWAASFRFYLEDGKRMSEQTEAFYAIR